VAEKAAPAQDRLDRWLWHARFFRVRSLAAKAVSGGKVRVNGQGTNKPARNVAPGDVLTFAQGATIRVVRVCAIAERRGSATEAALLYEDIPQHAGSGAPPSA